MENKVNNTDYCSRVFYDIAHEDFKSAEEAFSVIRPALEEFFRSEEYSNTNIGLYEAAKTFVDKHEWPSPDESVLISEDFKKFEAFVSKYTELDEKGVDFTIDDKVFDKPTLKTSVIKE